MTGGIVVSTEAKVSYAFKGPKARARLEPALGRIRPGMRHPLAMIEAALQGASDALNRKVAAIAGLELSVEADLEMLVRGGDYVTKTFADAGSVPIGYKERIDEPTGRVGFASDHGRQPTNEFAEVLKIGEHRYLIAVPDPTLDQGPVRYLFLVAEVSSEDVYGWTITDSISVGAATPSDS
jgi:hypothetical protein